jgi:acyl carrier protein
MQLGENSLKRVMADVFGIDASTIDETSSVDTIKEWDSLKHLNLVLTLESEFNVTLTEEQTVQILSYPLIKLVLSEHGIHFGVTSPE